MEMLLLIALCSFLYKRIFKTEDKPLSNEQADVLHGGE